MKRSPRHRFASVLLIPALALGGCAPTINPYTGEQQVSKTAQGAGVGAVSGAILGGVIGNNRGGGDQLKGAAWGAGIGALLGAGIGNYMDQQEAVIRAELEGTGVSVSRSGSNIVLNMPHDVTFESGEDRIGADFGRTLNAVALVLNKYDRTMVTVAGHTDSDGGTTYNKNLSERRAGSVAQYLGSRRVDSRRLIVRGYGESRPVASNNSSSGKAKNRRVEIHIVPQQ